MQDPPFMRSAKAPDLDSFPSQALQRYGSNNPPIVEEAGLACTLQAIGRSLRKSVYVDASMSGHDHSCDCTTIVLLTGEMADRIYKGWSYSPISADEVLVA